jgi:tetratricopeptide (TPR) repeat protein
MTTLKVNHFDIDGLPMPSHVAPIVALLNQGIFPSACLITTFQLSITPDDIHLCYLFGRSLLGNKEYGRAAHVFQKLLASPRGSVRGMPDPVTSLLWEDIRYYGALAYDAMSCFESALELLDSSQSLASIASQYQRPRTYLLYARLLRAFPTAPSSKIMTLYRRALELSQGTAVEALTGIYELSLSKMERQQLEDLIRTYSSQYPWLPPLLEGTNWFRQFRFAQALETFNKLNITYPDNPIILQNLAECQLQMSNIDGGRRAFDQLRRIDPFTTDGIDLYAMLLERHGTPGQVLPEELVRHILSLRAPHSPQVWTALAVYWKSKMQKEKAMAMVENALQVAPHHHRAHLLKGQLLLDQNKPEEAKECFHLAKIYFPTFQSYRGLVACKFKLNDPKGAMIYAKELKTLMYDSPRALSLYADLILKTEPTKMNSAYELYIEALKIDPQCVEAIISLAALHASQRRHEQAIAFLTSKIGGAASEADRGLIYLNLGKIFDSKNLYTEALVNYEEAYRSLPGMKDILDLIETVKAKLNRNTDQPGSTTDAQTEPEEEERSTEYETESSTEASFF